MDFALVLARELGGGVVGAALVLSLGYIVRGSIITAVQQGAARELESLRAASARELEAQRGRFARELEAFKTELTLNAEFRRQVVARRIAALEAIAIVSGSLAGALFLAVPTEIIEKNHAAIGAFHNELVRWKHLLPTDLVKEVETFFETVDNATDEDDWAKAQAATAQLTARIRRELGVAEASPPP
jgi:hypothetical protein